jgi:hypothetical protein
MSNLIHVFKNSLNKYVCEDIINKFNEKNKLNETYIKIPKHNDEWDKINKLLYKELLQKIKKYKDKLILENNDDILQKLSNDIITYNFIIYKKNITNNNKSIIYDYNKLNILTYIFVLNKTNKGGNIYFDYIDNKIYNFEQGELYLFPYDLNYIHKYISSDTEEQFIISGNIQIEKEKFPIYNNLRNIIKE